MSGVAQNFKGSRLANSPKFAGRISYAHIFDLGSTGTITPTAQIYYQTETFQSFANTIATRVPDYTRSDLKKKNIFLEAYVNNIEDKIIRQAIVAVSNVAIGYYSPPRTYGVRLGFRY